MIDFRLVTVSSLLIIFTSVFFVHYAFNNFITVIEFCTIKSGDMCLPANMFLLFMFSFAFVTAFVMVIETTIYLMFRGLEVVAKMGEQHDKKLENTIESLQKKKMRIENSKKDAHKKYLNREMEQETFKKLKQKYNSEIVEIDMQINELQKKVSKVL
jgi:hypothetical protein